MNIGILALQGCVEPHRVLLNKLGVQLVSVRTAAELASVDRLIIPGGESTTMLRLIELSNLWQPLLDFGTSKPVWGICAGAILIASEVENPKQRSFGLIDICAHRNHYGSQLDSFTADISVDGITGGPVHVDFIRAPLLCQIQGSTKARVLASHDSVPVFFEQENILACSFHSELTGDERIHEYFLSMPAIPN